MMTERKKRKIFRAVDERTSRFSVGLNQPLRGHFIGTVSLLLQRRQNDGEDDHGDGAETVIGTTYVSGRNT
jgi:hypothetical protein